jgi:DNA-binding transcriptional ArsR family regulator
MSLPPVQNLFRALGDPTRLAIVERLARGGARVTDIAAPFSMSLNAVSKHLKVLEEAGVVSRRIDGRVHEIYLKPEAFNAARLWMDRQEKFWVDRLENLRDFMTNDEPRSTRPNRRVRSGKGGGSE